MHIEALKFRHWLAYKNIVKNKSSSSPTQNMQKQRLYWHEYSSPEIKEIVDKLDLVLIPTGSIEQHGPHLSVIHDYQSTLMICEEIAKTLWPAVLILQVFEAGVSSHHITPKFAGTISLRADTYINILIDIANSLKKSRVRKALIVNGHGGNEAVNAIACKRAREDVGFELGAVSYWKVLESKDYEQLGFGTTDLGHSGEFETSMALARFPWNVLPERVGEDDKYSSDETRTAEDFSFFAYMDEVTASGYTDSPKAASAEKGEKAFQLIVARMVDRVRLFAKWNPRYKNRSQSLALG